jgi:hypothetical protein
MKRLFVMVLIVLALAVLGVGIAFAQGEQPPFGSMMGGMPMMGGRGYGPLHDYIEQAFAANLGLTEQQVEDALAAGTPMFQIALDHGILEDELVDFMNEVHKAAFANAVQDGVLTQAQADRMLQRMQNMFQNRYGPGNCPMHNGWNNGFGSGMMQNGGGWGPMR